MLCWTGPFRDFFAHQEHVTLAVHESVKRIEKELKSETVTLANCLEKFVEPEKLDKQNTWCVSLHA